MGTARRLLDEKRDEILRLAALHGAGQVRVFGSVARGDDGPDSDIDLLVLPSERCGLIEMIAFKQGVEALTGRTVDVVSERALHRLIRDQVLSEAKPL
jgi:predicted nucleotidyltransferase